MRDGFGDYVAGRSTSLRSTAYLLCGDRPQLSEPPLSEDELAALAVRISAHR